MVNSENKKLEAKSLQDNERKGEENIPPDGGYGWVIIFASFMCHFIADGIAFTFGVIYPDLLVAFGSSKSSTAWIGSMFVGVPLMCGPIAGLFVNKFGCRMSTLFGGIITSTGMLVSAFATSVEMLSFTYGVLAGFGLAFIYVPSSVMPSFWFEKRRALATGIAVAGSGLGTFAMAPLIEYLIEIYGWRGTLLLLSGISLNFMVFGSLYKETPEPKDLVITTKTVGDEDSASDLSSLVSCQSFRSLNTDLHNTEEHETILLFKNKATNTRTTEADLDRIDQNPHVSARQSTQVSHRASQLNQLLRSKISLLHISRPDMNSVMSLGLRKRTISSCPELNSLTSAENDASHRPRISFMQNVRLLAEEMCDVRLFSVPVYLVFFISNFMLSYAYDLPYIYVPDYAEFHNIARPSTLISIIGIVNTFGQVMYGYMGDSKRINTLLLYGLSLSACGITVSCLPLMRSYAALATFSTLFGWLISANFSLETVVLVKILSLEQLTKAYGLLMFGQGVASLIGPPIGGLLWDVTQTYTYTFVFSGLSIVISGCLALLVGFIRKKTRSRAISESTDISSPHQQP